MLTRRALLSVGISAAALACARRQRPSAQETQPTSKLVTVVLLISGMTWEGCVEPVRSALAAVKGVSRATVTLEGHEARVEYDPTQCGVDDLVAAVARVKDPLMPMTFSATVKVKR